MECLRMRGNHTSDPRLLYRDPGPVAPVFGNLQYFATNDNVAVKKIAIHYSSRPKLNHCPRPTDLTAKSKSRVKIRRVQK